MLRRRAFAPAFAVFAALALAACTPGGGVATPTPTELTEEQAYAAAEDAFTAYIDAVNQIDVADPTTFEPAFRLSTGDLNSFDRKQYSTWYANGWVEKGDIQIARLSGSTLTEQDAVAQLEVCLDVSAVTLVDQAGSSQVDPARPAIQTLYATVNRSGDGDWFVENLFGRADGTPC